MIPIQQALDGMIALMLAKLVLNDMPHAVGLSGSSLQPETRTTWELEDTTGVGTEAVKVYVGRTHLLLNGEEIGVVAYRAVPKFRSGSLVAMAVVEKFQGRSYGSLLLDRAIRELKSKGATSITTSVVGSEVAEGMLTRRGFKPFEEDPTRMYWEATG